MRPRLLGQAWLPRISGGVWRISGRGCVSKQMVIEAPRCRSLRIICAIACTICRTDGRQMYGRVVGEFGARVGGSGGDGALAWWSSGTTVPLICNSFHPSRTPRMCACEPTAGSSNTRLPWQTSPIGPGLKHTSARPVEPTMSRAVIISKWLVVGPQATNAWGAGRQAVVAEPPQVTPAMARCWPELVQPSLANIWQNPVSGGPLSRGRHMCTNGESGRSLCNRLNWAYCIGELLANDYCGGGADVFSSARKVMCVRRVCGWAPAHPSRCLST